MAISWDSLRSWNGSVRDSFEELCCQLAAAESVPSGSRFFRKGTPDAGVECYWELPDSQEWAWQAKWFRTSPSPAQWGQINRSVQHAIEKHPDLTRYTVCLPLNRSDGREEDQDSFLDKWNERVESWQFIADQHGMAVAFEFWGESEIGIRLSDERHRGRHWFWFNEERFSNSWFTLRVNEAVDNARDRYSENLNVDLPIRSVFESLGRTPVFWKRVSDMYSDAMISLNNLPSLECPEPLGNRYKDIQDKAPVALSKLSEGVRELK